MTDLKIKGIFGGIGNFYRYRLQILANLSGKISVGMVCTNGGRTAVQMGGVLQYKWEAYCRDSLSSKLRSQESTAIQMGGVLPYKLEVLLPYFLDKL